MEKSRSTREQELLDALERLLQQEGFQNIGVNAIAKEAGCNKVLIYRYFGGLDGIFEAFAARMKLITLPLENDDELSLSQRVITLFQNQHKEISQNALLKEIMKWELTTENGLTKALADEREKSSQIINKTLLPQIPSKAKELDVEAISAIISAGISYLTLRSDTARIFNGIDLQSEEGWKRIDRGVQQIITTLLEE